MRTAHHRNSRWGSIVFLMLGVAAVLTPVITGCDHSPAGPPDPPDFSAVALDVAPILGTYFFLSDPDSAAAPGAFPKSPRVYLDDRYVQNDVELGAVEGEAWIDPGDRTPAEGPYWGRFHLLQENVDYWYFPITAWGRPMLELREPLPPDHTLAVTYREVIAPGDTVEVGSVSPPPPGEPWQFKMIRPSEETWMTFDLPRSPWAPVRRLELRNAYDLGGRGLDPGRTHIRIVRDLGTDNPRDLVNEFGVQTPLIQVLGLDQRDNDDASSRVPDGLVDPEHINYDEGRLWFPDLRPFDPGPADVQGNDFRVHSWPKVTGLPRPDLSRPDTLGWTLAGGQPVRSSEQVLAEETVPEIYDLRPDVLSREAAEHHLYNIEVGVEVDGEN